MNFSTSSVRENMPLSALFRKNLIFFIPVVISLLTGIVFLLLFPRDVIHITQNSWHSPFFDFFFKYTTLLGDGFLFLPAAIILIFVKWRYFLGLVMVSVLTLLITGFLKQVVFEGQPRPVKYFELKHELRLVEGEEVHHHNSFPSGHSTTAFGCFGFLALITKWKSAKFLFFAAAAVAGYSRIYLSQHFLEDVVAGAIIGIFIAIVSYYLMQCLRWQWTDRRVRFKRANL